MLSTENLKIRTTSSLLVVVAIAGCHRRGHGQSQRTATTARDAAGKSSARPAPAAPKPLPTGVAWLTFDARAVPAALVHTGALVGGMRWRDKRGDNWLLLSRLDAIGGDSRSVYLSADHYLIAKGAPRLVREFRDHLDGCQLDLTARFLPASLSVTDLDGDGVGEATFAYELGCRGDVGPIALNVLTLEAGKKYIIRGNTRVAVGGGHHVGGSRRIDRSFSRAPKPFLAHAEKTWAAIVDE